MPLTTFKDGSDVDQPCTCGILAREVDRVEVQEKVDGRRALNSLLSLNVQIQMESSSTTR